MRVGARQQEGKNLPKDTCISSRGTNSHQQEQQAEEQQERKKGLHDKRRSSRDGAGPRVRLPTVNEAKQQLPTFLHVSKFHIPRNSRLSQLLLVSLSQALNLFLMRTPKLG